MFDKRILVLTTLILASCAHIRPDLCGTYQGVLPGADKGGITTTLVLRENKTYTQTQKYSDKDGTTFTENGEFNYTDNVITLTPINGQLTHYRVEGKNIRMLKDNKEMVTGEMSELYVLKHQKKCN